MRRRLQRSILGIATVLVLAACDRPPAGTASTNGAPMAVSVHRAVVERVTAHIESPATVRPAERATIAAKFTGTVVSLPWGLGQSVAAGEVLLVLDASEAEARVRQADALLAEAQRVADRARVLVRDGAAPRDVEREAEDRLRFARAAAAEAAAQLANATVRAPFSGVVIEKRLLAGDLATPGLPLLVLESAERMRAEGPAPERVAAGLHQGDEVAVRLDRSLAPVIGRIDEISVAADPASRSVWVKVALPEGAGRSGQFARLLFADGERDLVSVPEGALSRFGQMERVFVAEDGRAVLRLVTSGRTSEGRTEILSGLAPGEIVVLGPPADLRDGQPVTIRP